MSRELLLAKGWLRHSVISSTSGDLEKIQQRLPEKIIAAVESTENTIAIIATYDCAVVSDCFDKEPWVQLLLATPTSFEKIFAKGRDSRRIHVPIQVKGEVRHYEVNAAGMCQIPRETLLEISPDQEYLLYDTEKYDLKQWTAERYRQDTWPDAFNSSIKPAKGRLKRFWKRHNDCISGLYLQLNTYAELNNAEKYVAVIIIALEEGKQRRLLTDIKNRDKKLKGISIDDAMEIIENEAFTAFGDTINVAPDPTRKSGRAIEVVSEASITIQHLREFYRFSPYSLSEHDSKAPPPAEMSQGKAS